MEPFAEYALPVQCQQACVSVLALVEWRASYAYVRRRLLSVAANTNAMPRPRAPVGGSRRRVGGGSVMFPAQPA